VHLERKEIYVCREGEREKENDVIDVISRLCNRTDIGRK
jgi:hypothetical protein